MKDITNYVIIVLSVLISIIISCTSTINVSEDQLIGMWRINDNNDIIHFENNNIFVLTDWTCNKVYKKGNWELKEEYSMLEINDSLLFKINSIEYDKVIFNSDTIFKVYNLNPK